ncbi:MULTISPECIES: AAA family ATPase [unclassified Marinobacter]|uniref:AAA family ATPase n=1 Tax=unclassified Marinobacter TaxID=83889 RepID=UPI000C00E78A|nr:MULTISPECIES: AAA family ATPase [unclassified Marinobacter]PFG09289.1 putative ATPase [Marinobacter sp. LV10MA510-1]PFG51213.1 putative ATPase [Marinobacter sp. LV10R520-4]
MLNKLYIHQYRCLQNFEFNLKDQHSALILGRNGAGKSSFFDAVEVFQKIGRGVTQLKDLITESDFAFGETHKAIHLEINATIAKQIYEYVLEIELPENFSQPRIKKESLKVNGKTNVFREGGKVQLGKNAEFTLDWHHVGLPLISTRNDDAPIARFREWLAKIVVLAPVPSCFNKASKQETPYLERRAANTLDWVRHQLAVYPALYMKIVDFMALRMPDFASFKFESTGKNEKELVFKFRDEVANSLELNFDQLSDGEKIYFLTATVLAAITNEESVLCLWDEPDNYVSLPELSHFIVACRKAFENSLVESQMVMSSHNPRTINEYSEHNTYLVTRQSHLAPSRLEPVAGKQYLSATFIDAYENGELD